MAYLARDDDDELEYANASFDFDDEDGDEDIPEQLTPPEESTPYYPGINVCIICEERPPYSANGKSYPTCGMRCAKVLKDLKSATKPITPTTPRAKGKYIPRSQRTPDLRRAISSIAGPSRIPRSPGSVDDLAQGLQSLNFQTPPRAVAARKVNTSPCVVCLVGFCRDDRFVTCGLTCAEKLCKSGSANPNMCNYCHRRPKVAGQDQCNAGCIELAKAACLLCKSRPKFKKFHLCGKTCKILATKNTPLILEAVAGHVTYEFVAKKFQDSWKFPANPIPAIKKIFKIIEGSDFLQPYDRYKKTIGPKTEVFRYHGTTRKCTLGTGNNMQLCTNNACALCCILKTSFKTSLANPGGAFGPGVYSSSASNKAYSYTSSGSGAIILTKVVLGNIRQVNGWNEVMSCPPGFNSVVFDRQNGCLNETIVYSDDAIRPVFLITF